MKVGVMKMNKISGYYHYFFYFFCIFFFFCLFETQKKKKKNCEKSFEFEKIAPQKTNKEQFSIFFYAISCCVSV